MNTIFNLISTFVGNLFRDNTEFYTTNFKYNDFHLSFLSCQFPFSVEHLFETSENDINQFLLFYSFCQKNLNQFEDFLLEYLKSIESFEYLSIFSEKQISFNTIHHDVSKTNFYLFNSIIKSDFSTNENKKHKIIEYLLNLYVKKSTNVDSISCLDILKNNIVSDLNILLDSKKINTVLTINNILFDQISQLLDIITKNLVIENFNDFMYSNSRFVVSKVKIIFENIFSNCDFSVISNFSSLNRLISNTSLFLSIFDFLMFLSVPKTEKMENCNMVVHSIDFEYLKSNIKTSVNSNLSNIQSFKYYENLLKTLSFEKFVKVQFTEFSNTVLIRIVYKKLIASFLSSLYSLNNKKDILYFSDNRFLNLIMKPDITKENTNDNLSDEETHSLFLRIYMCILNEEINKYKINLIAFNNSFKYLNKNSIDNHLDFSFNNYNILLENLEIEHDKILNAICIFKILMFHFYPLKYAKHSKHFNYFKIGYNKFLNAFLKIPFKNFKKLDANFKQFDIQNFYYFFVLCEKSKFYSFLVFYSTIIEILKNIYKEQINNKNDSNGLKKLLLYSRYKDYIFEQYNTNNLKYQEFLKDPGSYESIFSKYTVMSFNTLKNINELNQLIEKHQPK